MTGRGRHHDSHDDGRKPHELCATRDAGGEANGNRRRRDQAEERACAAASAGSKPQFALRPHLFRNN
jgi:hypothetical protein